MKKPAIILISATVIFAVMLAGFFMGRISKDGTYGVYAQKSFRIDKQVEEESRSSGLVNINTASAEELQDLPGIGPATAEAIIEFREENGPFKDKKDIMNVTGIGEKTYNDIKSMITIEDEN